MKKQEMVLWVIVIVCLMLSMNNFWANKRQDGLISQSLELQAGLVKNDTDFLKVLESWNLKLFIKSSK